MTPSDSPAPKSQLSGKVLVITIITVIAAVVAYFATGMPGMDHGSGSSMDGMDMSSPSAPHRMVDAAGFSDALALQDAVVINVHVPYDGEIEGTDLFMPFDKIDPSALPSDQDTPLVVYCRSGTMSTQAVATLAGLGYTNIVELDGGMNAWTDSGRSVQMIDNSDG